MKISKITNFNQVRFQNHNQIKNKQNQNPASTPICNTRSLNSLNTIVFGNNFSKEKFDAKIEIQKAWQNGQVSEDLLDKIKSQMEEIKTSTKNNCPVFDIFTMAENATEEAKTEKRGEFVRKIDRNTYEIYQEDENGNDKIIGRARIQKIDNENCYEMNWYEECNNGQTNRCYYTNAAGNYIKTSLANYKTSGNKVTADGVFFYDLHGLEAYSKSATIDSLGIIHMPKTYFFDMDSKRLSNIEINSSRKTKDFYFQNWDLKYTYDEFGNLTNCDDISEKRIIEFDYDRNIASYFDIPSGKTFTFAFENGQVGEKIEE